MRTRAEVREKETEDAKLLALMMEGRGHTPKNGEGVKGEKWIPL